MANQFVELFKRYGWVVETLGENSFIASNDSIFVPFSCYDEHVSAASFLLCYKNEFIETWKKIYALNPIGNDIGGFVFKGYFAHEHRTSVFMQGGGIFTISSPNYTRYEIERCLEYSNELKGE